MEEIFNKLAEEFGLVVSISEVPLLKPKELYGKLPGFSGFLIAHIPRMNNIMVATAVEENANGPFFFGAEGFNNYTDAYNQVAKMIKIAKEKYVDKKIQNIQTDFNCKLNFT